MLEIDVLSVLYNIKDKVRLLNAIKENDFEDEVVRQVYRIMSSYYRKFFEFPSLKIFKDIVADYDNEGFLYVTYDEVVNNELQEGDYGYILEKFFKGIKKKGIDELIKKVNGYIFKDEYDKAIDVMMRGVQEYNERGIIDINRGNIRYEGDLFLENYNKIKFQSSDAMMTPIDWINEKTGGEKKGHFWVLGGYKGEGKTTGLINFAYKNVIDGYNVLICSLEMNHEDFLNKVYVRHIINFNSDITYDKVRKGLLTAEEEKAMKEAIDDFKNNDKYGDFNVVSVGSISVVGLEEEIKRYNPDALYIDYLQLVKNSRRLNSRIDDLSEVIKYVRGLALKYNIFIMTAHQINRKGYVKSRKVGHYSMVDFSESSEIEASATVLLSLYRNDAMKENNEVRVGLHKNRYGESDDLGHIAYLDISRNFLGNIEGSIDI